MLSSVEPGGRIVNGRSAEGPPFPERPPLEALKRESTGYNASHNVRAMKSVAPLYPAAASPPRA